jgi:hypothetical protein
MSGCGRWYVEVLWKPDEVANEWIQSVAHHGAHPNYQRGFATLEELFKWFVDRYGAPYLSTNEFFRMRVVWSTNGPPVDTRTFVTYWDLGVEI